MTTTTRSGGCLCGAVRYEARGVRPEVSACHCAMCRRWCSGPLFAVPVEALRYLAGEDGALRTVTSSPWAERGFCASCGSGLFFRVTKEGPHQGFTTVALGTLDDQTGITLNREWFSDLEPAAYHLEGERERLTSAQIAAMFPDVG
ncbi:MAG: GFA family protein [Myxococcota bacterium]